MKLPSNGPASWRICLRLTSWGYVVRRKSIVRSTIRILAWSLATFVVAVLTVIGSLFIHFSNLPWAWLRISLAIAFAGVVVGSFVFLRPRWKAVAVFPGIFAAPVLWYSLIPALNDRKWQPDVAHVVTAEFEGDTATVHNVRNFQYRSADDYDINWETRTYNLAELRSLDFVFSYWVSTAIAHTMLSFGFADCRYLCVSVETRKEIGETYDPMRSFFKQFELIYTVGDERDLVALRTNYRREDAYLFPVDYEPARIRALLLDILNSANNLAREPQHYRTIRDNCTTSLIGHINRIQDQPIPFSFKLILNGYMPEMAYERGRFSSEAPFSVVKQEYAISAIAQASGVTDDFSQRIRQALGAPLGTKKKSPQ